MTDYNLFQLASDYSTQGETLQDVSQSRISNGIFTSALKFAAASNLTRFSWNQFQEPFVEDEFSVKELNKLGIKSSGPLSRSMANYRLILEEYDKEFQKAVYSAQKGAFSTFAWSLGGSLAGSLFDPAAMITSFGLAVGITRTLKAFDLLKNIQNATFKSQLALKVGLYGGVEAALNVGHGAAISTILERPYSSLELASDSAFGLVLGTIASPKLGIPKATEKQLRRNKELDELNTLIKEKQTEIEDIKKHGAQEEIEPIVKKTIQEEYNEGLVEIGKSFKEEDVDIIVNKTFNERANFNLKGYDSLIRESADDVLAWNIAQFNKVDRNIPALLFSDVLKNHYKKSTKNQRSILAFLFNLNDDDISGSIFKTLKNSFEPILNDKDVLFYLLNKGANFLDDIGEVSPIFRDDIESLDFQRSQAILEKHKVRPVDVDNLSETIPPELIKALKDWDAPQLDTSIEQGDKMKQLLDISIIEHPELVGQISDWFREIKKQGTKRFEDSIKLLPPPTNKETGITEIMYDYLKDIADITKPTDVDKKQLKLKPVKSTFEGDTKQEASYTIDPENNAKDKKIRLEFGDTKASLPEGSTGKEYSSVKEIVDSLDFSRPLDRSVFDALRKVRQSEIGTKKILDLLNSIQEKVLKKGDKREIDRLTSIIQSYKNINRIGKDKNTVELPDDRTIKLPESIEDSKIDLKKEKFDVDKVVEQIRKEDEGFIEIPVKSESISTAKDANQIIDRAVIGKIDVDSPEYKQFIDSIVNDQNNLKHRFDLYQQTKDKLIKKELELDYPFSQNIAQRKRNKKILKNEFAKFGVDLPKGFVDFIKVVKGQIPFLDVEARQLYSDWLDFRYFEDIEVINRLQNQMQNFQGNWLSGTGKGLTTYLMNLRNSELEGSDYRLYREYVNYRLTGDKKSFMIIKDIWERTNKNGT